MRNRRIRVGYQGVPGAYSHEALNYLFHDIGDVEAIGFNSFESTNAALQTEGVDFCLVMCFVGGVGRQNMIGTFHTNRVQYVDECRWVNI